jgi:hypothetical protein
MKIRCPFSFLDYHPERAAFCAAKSLSRACRKDQGEPRDVARFCATFNGAGSHHYQTLTT